MPNIKSRDGKQYVTSEKVYVIAENDPNLPSALTVGTKVRKISERGSHKPLGWHPSEEYTTVCRADRTVAEFLGVKSKLLKRAHT